MGITRCNTPGTEKELREVDVTNARQRLTRSEINKRYRIRDPQRFKEQTRRAYLKRKVRIEKMKQIEVLNEILQTDE